MTILKENPASPGDSGKGSRAFFLIVALALGVSRVWVGGYSFGAADHAWQVPLVRGIAQGEALHDYIFQPAPRLSFYFPIVGFLARYWPVEAVYFAGYLVASAAMAAALYLLAAKMLVSRPAGLLAVVLLAVGKDTVAGATTWDAMFLPRTAALPVLLLGWWLLLEGRAAWAGVLAGLAFAVHPLTGIYGTAIAVAAIVLAERETWGPLWRFCAGAAVPVAATIVYTWGMPLPLWNAPQAWNYAMLVRNLHHLTSRSIVLLAGILVYAMAVTIHVGLTGGRSRLLIGATATAAVVFTYYAAARTAGYFMGFREPEMALLKPPAVAILQPLRMSGLLGILVFVATAGMLWRAMQKGLSGRLCAAGAAVALSWEHYVIGLGFLAGALLSQENSKVRRAAGVTLGILALAGAGLFHKTVLILFSAVVVASLVAALASKNTRFSAAWATLLATVALVGMVPASWAERAAVRAFGPEAVSRGRHYSRTVETGAAAEKDVTEATRWIRASAGADDVTIVPTWWESFRVLAQRPAYGTYKDGTLIFFNMGLAAAWADRMELLGVPMRVGEGSRQPEGDHTAYPRLHEERILEAVSRYPAKYIVRFRKDLPRFKTAFEGRDCVIYEITQAKEGQ